jgi:hypothetical protein
MGAFALARYAFALLLGAALLCLTPLAAAPSFAQTASQPSSQPSSKARTQPVAPKTWYTVTLATRFRPFGVRQAKKEFPDRVVYLTSASVFGQDLFLLRMGFFATLAEATAVKDKVIERYPGAWVAAITPGEYASASRSTSETAVISVPVPPELTAAPPAAIVSPPVPIPVPEAAPAPASESESKTATSPATDLERQAATLMEEGRAAIIREDNTAAIDRFTRILALPSSAQAQLAEEFLGLAWERQGDSARAKQVYEQYLRKYPEGEDAMRVRQRLANLSGPTPAPALREARKKETARTDIYGSVAQHYYNGNSKIDTETRDPVANTLATQSLSLTDQSALVNSIDFNWRRRTDTGDDRLVLRDTYHANFLDNQDDINRLTDAYYERRSKTAGWSARAGRQPGNTGGVIGRFDGLIVGKGLGAKWRLNAVAGQPMFAISDTKPVFYGLNAEFGPFRSNWSGNLYAIQQTVEGLLDRQAVGTELRYSTARGAVFSLLDYDTSFGELNTAYLQGSWQNGLHTTFNLLLDQRKTPTLQLHTAVIGESTNSIAALQQLYTEDELRARASALTATSTLASFGVTHPFNSTWQLGGDVRLSRISETTGTTSVPAVPDTGNVWTYSLQAIATAFFAERDVTVLSVSAITADTYDGQALSLTSRALFGANWTLDSTLNWYAQSGPAEVELSRLSPLFRLSYLWKDHVTLDAELGAELSRSTSPTVSDRNQRNYFSFGYRWDF